MASRNLLWRLSLRRVIIDRSRTLLMIAMIMLPVWMGTAVLTVRSTSDVPIETRTAALIGQSAGVLHYRSEQRTLPDQLEEGNRALHRLFGPEVALAAEIDGPVAVTSGPLESDAYAYGLEPTPIHEGRFVVQAGVQAGTETEATISRSVARDLDLRVGDRVSVSGRELTVAGVAVIASDISRRFIVITPQAATDLVPVVTSDRALTSPPMVLWHIARPLDQAQEDSLNEASGWSLTTRSEQEALLAGTGSGPDEIALLVVAVFVFAMAELGLLIFAVQLMTSTSTRRDLRVLNAVGTTKSQCRAIFARQALITGLIGSGLGTVVGVASAAVVAPLLAERQNQLWQNFRLSPITIALVGLAIGSAVLGTVTATRITMADAAIQSGEDPPETAPTRKTTAMGIILLAVGLTLCAMALLLRAPGLVFAAAIALVIAGSISVRVAGPAWQSQLGGLRLHLRFALRFITSQALRTSMVAVVLSSLIVAAGLVLGVYGGMTAQASATYVPQVPNGSMFVYATSTIRPDTLASARDVLADTADLAELGVASPPRPQVEPGLDPLDAWGLFTVDNPNQRCATQGAPNECVRGTGYPLAVTYLYTARDVRFVELVVGRTLTDVERTAFTSGTVLITDDRLSQAGVVRLEAPTQPGSTGRLGWVG